MSEKKDFLKLLGCIFICVVLFGSVVCIADPFYQYHAPWLDMPIVLDNAVYQTAGAARNLEYDSAIIGTSMTENIRTSWLDEELGWETMKLSYSGARSNDLQAIFEQVEKKDGALEHIVMDINDYQLTCESWTSYVVRPKYLYDDYLYNDYEYVFNHDTFVLSIERFMDGIQGVQDNTDTAYTWEEDSLFSKEIAQDTCRKLREKMIKERSEALGEDNIYLVTGQLSEELDEKLQICQENLDNITPFIEAHPETEITILVPPYSILYWEERVLDGDLEDMLAIYAYAYKTFLQYDNVRMFYFQNEQELITNLDNYRDNAHHKPEYNRYMIDCMISGKNELTLENYKEKLAGTYDFVKDYPYASLWVE